MTAKILEDVLHLAETWPESAQLQLAEVAREIDAELSGGLYYPTSEELAGIDRGLKDISEGRIATVEQIERLFNKHRPA
jgi:predicted transcriptional regulator